MHCFNLIINYQGGFVVAVVFLLILSVFLLLPSLLQLRFVFEALFWTGKKKHTGKVLKMPPKSRSAMALCWGLLN